MDELDLCEIRAWAVKEIRLHVQRDGERVLENVTPEGEELPGSAGRLMVPGMTELICIVLCFLSK